MPVSVVMAVYNGAWCVERALESVLAQTVKPREILVCDDGSTDGTPDLVERRFGGQVTVLRLPHQNAAAARHAGLLRAQGQWLAFMDADDRWFPDKLERQLEGLERHPDVRHVSSDGAFESAEGVLRESWLSDYFHPVRELAGDLYPLLLERCFVLMSSTMVERRAYEEVGGIDRSLVYSHDYDLWLRILGRYPGLVLPDRLVTYWWSPGALSRRIDERYADDLELMRRAERGLYRSDPAAQRRGSERAATLEYKLGIRCLKAGRLDEGRERLRRASAAGPARQRIVALAGSLLPSWALSGVARSAWLKRSARLPGPVRVRFGSSDERVGGS